MDFTTQLFLAVEDNQILDCTSSNMQFEYFSDDMDGVFPRVNEWTAFLNRIDKNGLESFFTFIGGKDKLNINNGYCTIVRESKYNAEATLIFKEPVKCVVGYFDNEPIIRECTKLKGIFDYQFYFTNNGRQNKIANSIEIDFKIKEYFK